LPTFPQARLYFDGETYDPDKDAVRLTKLMLRVWSFVQSGEWVTLSELANATGGTEASVSARLRDLRKERFGAHTVERRRMYNPTLGAYEYRVIPNRRVLP